MEFIKKLQKIVRSAPTDLRKRLIAVFLFLLFFNVLVWVLGFFAWQKYPLFLGLFVLSFGLGLRHGVDADHIAAIDSTTRKFISHGKKPVAVGLFFSLGHSTIVILLSLFLAVSGAFIKLHMPTFEQTGSFIGTFISSFFLLTIGVLNFLVLIDIFQTWKQVVKEKKYPTETLQKYIGNKGLMTHILKPIFKTINRSWHMYIVGFLFGLGFDTASEVGLLSISGASGISGMPIGVILLLPLAFTAGMTLVDTLDGIFMLGAYGWAYIKPARKLYYNLTITCISVIIAIFIGGIEALQLIIRVFHLKGAFFSFISNIRFGSLGYIIIFACIVSWGLSLLVYKIKRYDLLDM